MSQQNKPYQPIGVFDSGFGGLTVLKEIIKTLPQYDFVYLGDNARAPYGSRSYETVYQYTLECVKKLFDQGCELVILACNTASAKALRSIQQIDLPKIDPNKRVLGVIRPTTEVIGQMTKSKHVGILGTAGTVSSGSYIVEIEKFFPELTVYQQACPQLVPLIENNEAETEGAEFFIEKYVSDLIKQAPDIDAVVLGCTHYPLIQKQIQKHLPPNVHLLSQGPIIAESLKKYLALHPEMEQRCSKNAQLQFYTTDTTEAFDRAGTKFFGSPIHSKHMHI
ncbi:MAG: glutamate racemase [Bacteroidota bacterium]